MAEIERAKNLATGRRILAGSDSPARRQLIELLDADRAENGPDPFQPLGCGLSPASVSRIRSQLRDEFSNLFSGSTSHDSTSV
jgi:hypothetical protein